MPSIGQILREAREKRGASISEVSHATRIKIDYLEKMESDQFDRLIAPAYATSFLRMYSTYLGLNAAEMLEQFRSWQPTKAAPSAAAPIVAKTPRKPAMPSSSSSARSQIEQRPAPTPPVIPPPPKKEMPRETTVPISGTKAVADSKNQLPKEQGQKPPPAPSSPPPTKPASTPPLRLKEEPKKATPPSPPVSASRPHSFPLNAMLVVVIVVTISLTAIVWLWQRTRKTASTPVNVELNARETLRSSPARSADVLPLPPPP